VITLLGKHSPAHRARRLRLLTSAILGMLALAGALLWMAGRPAPAQAKPSFLDAFKNTYPAAASSKIAECSLCHTASIPILNPYGADYKRLGQNFAAIETLDSDGDGALNLAEIRALTWPGDPADRPTGATATATRTMTASPSPTATATQTTTVSPSPTATATQTTTVSPSPTATATQTTTVSPSPTATATQTTTVSPSPTATATQTTTVSPSPTATATPTLAGPLKHLYLPLALR